MQKRKKIKTYANQFFRVKKSLTDLYILGQHRPFPPPSRSCYSKSKQPSHCTHRTIPHNTDPDPTREKRVHDSDPSREQSSSLSQYIWNKLIRKHSKLCSPPALRHHTSRAESALSPCITAFPVAPSSHGDAEKREPDSKFRIRLCHRIFSVT
jgi:hypothetical protein